MILNNSENSIRDLRPLSVHCFVIAVLWSILHLSYSSEPVMRLDCGISLRSPPKLTDWIHPCFTPTHNEYNSRTNGANKEHMRKWMSYNYSSADGRVARCVESECFCQKICIVVSSEHNILNKWRTRTLFWGWKVGLSWGKSDSLQSLCNA